MRTFAAAVAVLGAAAASIWATAFAQSPDRGAGEWIVRQVPQVQRRTMFFELFATEDFVVVSVYGERSGVSLSSKSALLQREGQWRYTDLGFTPQAALQVTGEGVLLAGNSGHMSWLRYPGSSRARVQRVSHRFPSLMARNLVRDDRASGDLILVVGDDAAYSYSPSRDRVEELASGGAHAMHVAVSNALGIPTPSTPMCGMTELVDNGFFAWVDPCRPSAPLLVARNQVGCSRSQIQAGVA